MNNMYKFTQDFGENKKGDEWTREDTQCSRDIRDILLRINILKEENLRKQCWQYIKMKKWKPEEGETYWFVGSRGGIYSIRWCDHSYDRDYFYFNNCFKTAAAAIKARDAVKKLLEGMDRG